MADNLTLRVEQALLSHPGAVDCAVIKRTGPGGDELVGYVVPSGIFRAEGLLSAVRASVADLPYPLTLMPVSAIPLRDDGEVEEATLTALPMTDAKTVVECNQPLRHLGDTRVELQDSSLPTPLLRMSDLLSGTTRETHHVALENVDAAKPGTLPSGPPALSRGEPLEEDPTTPATLQLLLKRAAQEHPDKGVIYAKTGGVETFQSYPTIVETAERVLGGLRGIGLNPGDKVLFQIQQADEFLAAFWGCILGGFVPVPVSIAADYGQLNGAITKLRGAWEMLDHPPVLASDVLAEAVRGIADFASMPGLRVEAIGELLGNSRDHRWHISDPDDLGILLLTSGSTGKPKAVMQSHRALLARSRSSVRMNRFTPDDISLNWLPLDHVGGLVMFHLHDVAAMCMQVHARTQDVLENPLQWIDWLDRYRATSTWAPNFAYGLVNAQFEEIGRRRWDLSPVRFILNGGEAIVSKTARRFLSLLAPHGLRDSAMHPAWGMSETCSGVTFVRDFSLLTTSDADLFVEVGAPIPGFAMRIVNQEDGLLPEGAEGRLQVQGPSVLSGYFQNPEANRESFTEDGWFTTGDLGVIRRGRLTITGREKDVIIVNGANYHAHEIENIVEGIKGIEPSFTAAFAVRDPGTDTDRLAICFCTSGEAWTNDKDMASLLRQIRSVVIAAVGVNPAYLVPVSRGSIPKTAIGKIQRSELAIRLRSGMFDDIVKRVDMVLNTGQTIPDWFYHKIWRRRRAKSWEKDLSGSCLIFADAGGTGESVAKEIAERGGSIGVLKGKSFKRISRDLYCIDHTDPGHYISLLEAISAEGRRLGAVVHLWACDEVAEPVSQGGLQSVLDTGLLSVLYLAQALARNVAAQGEMRLLVVTRDTQGVGFAHSSSHSALAGFLRTIRQEIPSLTCCNVDLEITRGTEDSRIVQLELAALPADPEVAYRDGQRWVARIENANLTSMTNEPFPLVKGGFYLLTGGLGAIGLDIARHLAQQYHARLLLIGRTTPEHAQGNSEWNALEELKSLGGDARYQTVDVCDAGELSRVVAAAEKHWEMPLTGVFHLAGLYQERLIADETCDTFLGTIAPKVQGTWAVRQMLHSRPDAFLIGFSSVNGFFGGFSCGAYAAANAFLDGSIEQEKAKGRRAISLAWSLWDEMGMSRGYGKKDLSRAQGFFPISRTQGWKSLVAALRSTHPVIFIGLDANGRQVRRYADAMVSSLQKLVVAGAVERSDVTQIVSQINSDRFGVPVQLELASRDPFHSAGAPEQVWTRPASDLERTVAQIWAETLEIDVSLDGNFFDLGGTSILVARVYQKIHALVGDRISMTDLFRYPTVRTLCAHCAGDEDRQSSSSLAPKTTRKPMRAATPARSGETDIAIIGVAGRFPGARNVQELWRNIRDGAESIHALALQDLERAGMDSALLHDPSYVPAVSTIEEVEMFDASFFGFSPREASLLDPQSRLFLECAWESLESAGYNPQKTGQSVGVFASQSMSTYLLRNVHSELTFGEFVLAGGNLNAILGNGNDFLPTRVSYKLNLQGPSINVQTACSSSLVAVHIARQSLLSGECDMALAGGVSIYLPQEVGYRFQEGMILSPDGHCRPFDADARGTIFGRGVGIVVLRPLAAAIRDSDQIYAIIKGSAINNDGSAKVGYTAPGVDGQANAIAQALANAGLEADAISYIEAHGTGTPQGDPMEIAALTRAFQETTTKKQFCALGSIKGNIGHLDVAAGITGLIKTALMLKHRVRPPSLNYRRPNPQIDFANTPFYVNAASDNWPTATGVRRRAGVSSFGMGGTNAHVVLEEAPDIDRPKAIVDRPVHLFTLSAKTPQGLRLLASRQAAYLDSTEDALADICYTAATGREHWSHRLAFVGDSSTVIRDQLRVFEQNTEVLSSTHRSEGANAVAFVFTGQGAQYPHMARQLYDTQPVFRATIDRCAAILETDLSRSLIELLYPKDPDDRALDTTNFTQPALFAVEYALAELWRSWGIIPGAVMGHSLGEYVAACVAGGFSLEDGLHLVAERGRLMHSAPGLGEMVAVFSSEHVVQEHIQDARSSVALAAINGPAQVVVSGEPSAMNDLLQGFDRDAIQWQRLPVSHAFHSACMDPILGEFEEILKGVHFHEPQTTVISNVSGRAVRPGEITSGDYWRKHLRQPVRFAQGIQSLLELGYRCFIEVGPHPALTGSAKTVAGDRQCQWLHSLRRGSDDWTPILQTLAALYMGGATIDWRAFESPYSRRHVALPTYPFERQRHWIEAPARTIAKPVVSGLPGQRLKSPAMIANVFETEVSTEQSYIGDHRLFGMAVFPATGYLIAAVGAAEAQSVAMPIVAENFILSNALIVQDGSRSVVQSVLSRQDGEVCQFQFYSQNPTDERSDWLLHASGTIRSGSQGARTAIDLGLLRQRCNEPVDIATHYAQLEARGLRFGPAFRGLSRLFRGTHEALGYVRLPEHLAGDRVSAVAHPAFLDAAQQTLIQAAGDCTDESGILVPIAIDRLIVFGGLPQSIWSHAKVTQRSPGFYSADIGLYDEAGALVMDIQGLRVQRVQADALKRVARGNTSAEWLYGVEWQADGRTYSEEGPAAPLLSSPRVLAGQIAPMLEPLGVAESLPQYREMLAGVDRLCALYAARAFHDLGWRPAPGERITSESLRQMLGVLPRHARLLRRLLQILEEEHHLKSDGNEFTVVGSWDAGGDQLLLKDLLRRYADAESHVQIKLVASCGEQLAAVMRGTVDPLQILFPDGSTANLEALYGRSTFARVYNRLAGDVMAAAGKLLPKGQRLRVIEVGAGTGGTTRYVLPKLQQPGVEYVFSDVGNIFLHRARDTFKQYPNVRFEVLDVERDPLTQGFTPHQFDIVLASNVLHATADLRQTIGYMKDLLAPEGLLVFVEGTSPARWVDLTFGLTEGWWKFTDSDLRSSHPLLSREKWIATLGDLGFSEAATFPRAEQGEGDGWQIIGVARGPAVGAASLAEKLENRQDPWVLVQDRSGFASALRHRLALRGEAALTTNPEHLRDTLRGIVAAGRPIRGIVHLAALDASVSEGSAAPTLEEASALAAGSTLALVQAIAAAHPSDPPQLWIVTRGVHDVAGKLHASSLPQSLIWGLGRTLAFEHPEFRSIRIDLDPEDEDATHKLCQELLAPDKEDQIAIRGLQRYVARLGRKQVRTGSDSAFLSGETRSLAIGERGVLDNLCFATSRRRPVGPSEVEIRVHSTGLNFRDVLNALGMYPGPAPPFGGECSGTVVSVGVQVRAVRPGDEVVAIAYDSFATSVLTREEFVTAKPPALSFEDAATLPVAFLTADYALNAKAKLGAGERVLIHAAAGGVGYAAVQLALRHGAEVFATAGSPEKRQWLHSVGVQHVFDSRTTAFASAVLDRTGGTGVHVVLNSLAGDTIAASLSTLAPGGRFVELGKSGIWECEQVAARYPKIEYFVIDFAAESEVDPSLIARRLPWIVAQASTGAIRPLPVQTFPQERVVDAFRYMAKAKHIGKIVVTQQPAILGGFHQDAMYLLTGGHGALGLAVVKWMTVLGARHFVLMNRTAPSGAALAQIDELKALGASITLVQGDVARQDDVQTVVERIAQGGRPLRGVIHSAGALNDGVLLQQTWKRFEDVFAAKVSGAWNLHVATAHAPLDFFILFSSVASLLGSAGQGNHAAANAFLDALAFTRRHQGRAALSINWGPWSQIGAAATATAILDRVRLQGMDGIPPDAGLQIFDELLRSSEVQVGVLPVNWDRFVASFGDHVSPYFSRLVGGAHRTPQTAAEVKSSQETRLVDRALAVPVAERRTMLVTHIRDQVRRALGFDSDYVIDDRQPLNNIGLDSLMAVELRNILGASLSMKRSLPATLLFDYPTIDTLADYLMEALGLVSKQTSVASNDERSILAAEIEHLSEEEAEMRLLQELASMPTNRKGGQ